MKQTITIFLLCFLSVVAFGQTSPEVKWEDVIITRNPADIKDLKRINDVSAETSRLYGKQSKLRDETTIKIKQEAAKLGATIVFITVDNFAMTPINNINMVGTAYSGNLNKKDVNQSENKDEKTIGSNKEIKWEDVIITRNPEDVKGLKRINDVSAETSRLYGKQSKLRDETTVKIKQEAAKLGATIVFITVDSFAMTPINNINMVGTAYK